MLRITITRPNEALRPVLVISTAAQLHGVLQAWSNQAYRLNQNGLLEGATYTVTAGDNTLTISPEEAADHRTVARLEKLGKEVLIR